QAFGQPVETRYRLDRANVILALDSDIVFTGNGAVRYAREFAGRRRPEDVEAMSRLYAAETMPTLTGSRADHPLAGKPSEVQTVARQVAAALGVAGVPSSGSYAGRAAELAPKWVAAVAKDLLAHKGASLVIAGDAQPPAVHVLAHAMNSALGNVGQTVV